jgi:hypothetical protein
MSTRKRKHGPPSTDTDYPTAGDLDNTLLHIQAYEADVRCSPTSAKSLEANSLHTGKALIRYSAANEGVWVDRYVRYSTPISLRVLRSGYYPRNGKRYPPNPHIWFVARVLLAYPLVSLHRGTLLTLLTTRYDARLILDPDSISAYREERRPSSPSGWSDIPSDAEDTFFFTQVETDDYRRYKRRRLMESAREERLRALAQLDPADEPQETCWASDEEVRVSETLELVSKPRI